LAILVWCACSARLGTGVSPDENPGDGSALGPWGTPTPVAGASDPSQDTDNETLNSTMTEMYFTIVDDALPDCPKQMYLMTRASASDAWGTPTPFTVVNTQVQTESPRLTPNDLTLYYGSDGDIYTITRGEVGGTWSSPTPYAPVNNGNYAKWMAVCDGGYFMVSRFNGSAQGQDLFDGQLGDSGNPVDVLNSTSDEISTFLSNDCLTVYFASDRSGSTQIYGSTRPSTTSGWAAPTMITDFGSASTNKDLWMSTDQRTAYFASIRGSDTLRAVYMSTR
jgi:hypothetical protein